MWAAPGLAGVGVGTGTSAVAAEGSWDYCAGLVTPQGPDAAVAVAFGGGPAAAKPEKMEVQDHSEQAERAEAVAEDLLQLLHLPHSLIG